MSTLDELLSETGFVEQIYFEGNPHYRRRQQELFIEGEIYAPEYDYPKLFTGNFFIFDKARIHAKRVTLKALSYHLGEDKAELYYARLKRDYRKRLLVETAEKLRKSTPGSRSRLATEKRFSKLNRELFGKVDKKLFFGLMDTERRILDDFVPKDLYGAKIKYNLQKKLEHFPDEYHEKLLLSGKTLTHYNDLVQARYGNIFDAIPDSTNKYDAETCAQLMNQALQAGGLYQQGWRARVDSDKVTPMTLAGEKCILLPVYTKRSATELRCLVLHEQEVHARRAHNGSRHTALNLLETGTATYNDAEEGLGVLLEAVTTGEASNPAIERARQRYIHTGLAMGLDGEPRDACQVFEITWRLLAVRLASQKGEVTDKIVRKAKTQAMLHIENIFRGTDFVTPGLCYSKAKIYYDGLLKNVRYARAIKDGDEQGNGLFDQQFIGKYDHTNKHEREAIARVLA